MLGSRWAYYELGLGRLVVLGSVENASFMPWLVGTALMHSLAVTMKNVVVLKAGLYCWLFVPLFCLLGTFQ